MKTANSIFLGAFLVVTLLVNKGMMAQESGRDDWSPLQREIVMVEREFQLMTQTDGIASAFRYFAAPNAVLNRNNALIKGPEAIYEFYNKPVYLKARVNWAPTEVTVSESGDLAQSYGTYTWVVVKDDGTEQVSEGIFMTVWQRQIDGTWHYIWD